MKKNNIISNNFLKIFYVKENAEKFAREKGGKISVHYDWDDMRNKVIKHFIVKY